MSDLSELDDDVGEFWLTRPPLGTCQATSKSTGKRCRFPGEIKRDGSAYCKKHEPKYEVT